MTNASCRHKVKNFLAALASAVGLVLMIGSAWLLLAIGAAFMDVL